MKKLIEKAQVLLEALPYIKSFWGKRVVVKYGGNAMVNETLRSQFAQDVILLRYIGIKPIVIHGGGPQIGQTLERMGKETRPIFASFTMGSILWPASSWVRMVWSGPCWCPVALWPDGGPRGWRGVGRAAQPDRCHAARHVARQKTVAK